VKLNELYTARMAMTPGKYVYSPVGCIDAPDCREPCVEVATLGGRNRPEDGLGLVVTHNAADVLIDIAFSGLALIRVLDRQKRLDKWQNLARATHDSDREMRRAIEVFRYRLEDVTQ